VAPQLANPSNKSVADADKDKRTEKAKKV